MGQTHALRVEKPHEPMLDVFEITQFAFPHGQHAPPKLPQFGSRSLVTIDSGQSLRRPEFRVGCRSNLSEATGMHVPEAAIHENNLAPPREDEIRRAGEIRNVQPVAIAERVKSPSHQHFWFGIHGPDPRHVPAPLLRSKYVDHDSTIRSARFVSSHAAKPGKSLAGTRSTDFIWANRGSIMTEFGAQR